MRNYLTERIMKRNIMREQGNARNVWISFR